jgi:hypothetical protein
LALAVAAVILFLVWLIRPQYKAWADTRELKHEIEAEQVDVNQAWTKYQEITGRNHLGFVTWGLDGPLKSKLMATGDRPILDFRDNDYPTSREAHWKIAVTSFARALAVDPGDRTIKGKLRLCEGHVERITASGASRQQMINEAAMKFQESADLLKSSPDPHLGLERLFAYTDPDRAQLAADKAAQLGHAPNRREMAQLADGYFGRARQTVHDAARLRGMLLSEREYLLRARRDYEHARSLYSQVGAYGKAADTLIESVHGIDTVQVRLQELDNLLP